jgi:hypothetical protein
MTLSYNISSYNTSSRNTSPACNIVQADFNTRRYTQDRGADNTWVSLVLVISFILDLVTLIFPIPVNYARTSSS